MAHYLVFARPKADRLARLGTLLEQKAFRSLRPFGAALTHGLTHARVRPDGLAVWEEEDYCTPPLAEERAAVLDEFFDELEVSRVTPGAGWRKIAHLPPLFPGLKTVSG